MTDQASDRHAIGRPVPRKEDRRLVAGGGRYTDDVSLPGEVHGVVVRSLHAHGHLRGVGISTARAMPGVLAVYTAADMANYGSLPCIVEIAGRDGATMRKPHWPVLADGKVRHVGEAVAFVVAETAAQARDAAEAVELDIDPLPAVIDAAAALAPGAPPIHDEVPGNLALDFEGGDPDAVEAAMARAAHVTRVSVVSNRVVVTALEPRAVVATYLADAGRWEVHVQSQGTFGMRAMLAGVLKVAPEQVRILTGNVGGSFGMKAAVYPEYVCACHAARDLGRPVRWLNDRSASFLSDSHGRDLQITAELALDGDGTFLAVRLRGLANLGAYLGHVSPVFSTANLVKNLVSVYRTPAIAVAMRCAFTNTTFLGPYRGAGRPDANYVMERLIDAAARETGRDPADLRRLNHIRPGQIPYPAPNGLTYDSGNFPAVFERALEAADWAGFPVRAKASADRGLLRGRGIGSYLEVTAPPNREMGGIRFEPDGMVSIITGTLDYGQGHATPFAQILSERLGIPFERIRLVQGDSDLLIYGAGTGGSRSAMMSGAAIVEASDLVIEKGKRLAGLVLEAAVADIEFAAGRFTVAGTDLSISLLDLAERQRQGLAVPDDMAVEMADGLDVTHVTGLIPSSFPNGTHVAEVEIDPETGATRVVRYTMVNDFGTILNPLLVEGQLHGGVVQGIGQALMERTIYDMAGQLVTGSLTDYALPRADDAPDFSSECLAFPATTNPLGIKGCGEAGCAGSLSAVTNAIIDALSAYGVTAIDMPATPESVWRALRGARRTARSPDGGQRRDRHR
jgi:carbon-monoxide dehydrogenase large subunit